MGVVRDFRDLTIWQRAMGLAEATYAFSRSFPSQERFGLTSQLRRAVLSIASNIAEGHARESRGEFLRFLSIARGSLEEVQTQLILAQRLGYCADNEAPEILDHCDELGRMMRGMQETVGEGGSRSAK